MATPAPYADGVKKLAEVFIAEGWTSFNRNTAEENRGNGSCHKCRSRMTMTGMFGLGLQYCISCKIAVDVGIKPDTAEKRTVQIYWDGNLYSSGLHEIIDSYYSHFKDIAIRTGIPKKYNVKLD